MRDAHAPALRGSRRSERGQVLGFAALLIAVIIAFTALSIDVGSGQATKARDQNVADLAALAAAYTLITGGSQTAATQAANSVLATAPHGPTLTVTYLTSGGAVAATAATTALVRATVSDRTVTLFAGYLGFPALNIAAVAESPIPGASLKTVMTLLGSSTASSMTSHGGISLTGGGLAVDSAATPALSTGSYGFVSVPATSTIGVVGGVSGGGFSPAPVTGIAPVADPLVNVPYPPNATAYAALSVSGATVSPPPGVYPSISIGNGGVVHLSAGVYIITNPAGVQLSPGATLDTPSGAMIFFTCPSWPVPCAAGTSGAGLSVTNATLTVSAPTSGPYRGMALFFDRNDVASIATAANTTATVTGTIYGPSMSLSIGSNTDFVADSLIVASSVQLSSLGSLVDNYDPAYNYPIAPYGAMPHLSL